MLASKQIPEVGKGHLICVMIRFKTLLSGSIPVKEMEACLLGVHLRCQNVSRLSIDLVRSLAMFKRQG